jgi:hypothetical protein
MRLDSSGNLGIGTSSPTDKLQVGAFSGNNVITVGAGTAGVSSVYFGDGTGADRYRGYIDYVHTSDRFEFGTSATTKATLDSSGNLGIGTSSPGQKLEVAGNIFVNTSGNPYAEIKTSGAGNNPSLKLTADTNSWTFQGTFSNANDDLLVLYNATTLLDLTKDGNLGLGVTPSAWGGTYKAQQIGQAGVLAGHGSLPAFTLASNAYENSGWKAITTNPAQRIDLSSDNNATIFYRAASATAGSALSWVETARFDSSGNLDLGTTGGSDRYQNIIATSAKLTFNAGTGFTGSAATSIYNQSAIAMIFGTNNTERARIDSAGRVLVNNTTLDAGYISVRQGTYYSLQSDTTSTSAGVGHVVFTVNGGTAGTITTSNTTTAYNTSSDCRLKENISVADDAGELIDSIEIVKHDWKAGGHTRYGAIAQDLHEVFPEAVAVGDADDVDELKTPWGVDYSKLVPMLVKEIQSLRARVAQLESK